MHLQSWPLTLYIHELGSGGGVCEDLIEKNLQQMELIFWTPDQHEASSFTSQPLDRVKGKIFEDFYILHVVQRANNLFFFSVWRKAQKLLPRSHQVFNLYQYSVPENIYQDHIKLVLAFSLVSTWKNKDFFAAVFDLRHSQPYLWNFVQCCNQIRKIPV